MTTEGVEGRVMVADEYDGKFGRFHLLASRWGCGESSP